MDVFFVRSVSATIFAMLPKRPADRFMPPGERRRTTVVHGPRFDKHLNKDCTGH
jgi:hypothetical protein